MKRIFLALPFTIMLFLGGIYAWSMFVPSLKEIYGLSASQTQWIFGMVIAAFTTSMLWTDKLLKYIGFRGTILLSALLFSTGYLLASFSGGDFFSLFFGIGILSGIGTGLGYMSSLSVPVTWDPDRKGMVTGLVSGGFAAGSILLTFWVGEMLNNGNDVLVVFRYIAIFYGTGMIIIAMLLPGKNDIHLVKLSEIKVPKRKINIMFSSIFLGTFAGLLVIGNIKLIGGDSYSDFHLSAAIMLFALANFTGRLFWGWISDKFSAIALLSVALSAQGIATFLIGHYQFPIAVFCILIMIIGIGFGSNFVLFARETAQMIGVERLGKIYPIIFLGYGLAGIFGPVTGGILFDQLKNFELASTISLAASLLGILIFALETPGKAMLSFKKVDRSIL
jgi:MFS transporter, OFA family, oxalate/formate antiporter